ncbi:MAG: DUF177 domain-containing protein [Bacilli bacterium]|nr:DUF177 domain-containing protein [Bacilli bacterium]
MLIDLDFDGDYIINSDIILPIEYYKDSEIHNINHLHIDGKLYYDSDNIVHAILEITGNMIISDSISLEEVSYPFSIEYDDILEESYRNDENKLDLFEFLWENIVLEIPLRFTKVQDLSKFHGDGWKLISDEEIISSSNPFSDLLKNFDKKE